MTPNFVPNVLSNLYQKTKKYEKGYKFLMIGTTFCKFLKIVFTNHIFKYFMFTQKYQTQQKSLTTNDWIDSPGIYIGRVTPLSREDAA